MRTEFPTGREEKRRMLFDAVESVRAVVTDCAADSEANATLSPAVVEALHQAGLFSLKLPNVLGGAEADPVTQIEVIEALSRIDSAASWCVMIGATSIARPGAFLPDEAITQIFANDYVPRATGVGAFSGNAVPCDGGYLVTGRWAFASGIRHSQWLGAAVKVTDSDGTVSHRTAVLPTSHAEIHYNWDVAGLKGTGSDDFSLTDQFVPTHFTWDSGQVFPERGGALYCMGRPGFVICEHVGFALGVARRALDVIQEVAMVKKRGPLDSSLAGRGVFQHALGQCDLKLRAARSLALEVSEASWQMVCELQKLELWMQAELRSTAAYVTEVSLDCVTRAFRYGGGAALHQSHGLQQCLRDMNAAAQHFMVNDSAYEHHGKFMLGLPEANPMG